jgi:nitrite reductase/ring-hydroxylating ferredoxin subunit
MKIFVAEESEIAEGEAASFRFVRKGRYVGGFIVRYRGALFSYENRCRHIPISLDYDDSRYFDEEKRYLICQTHGATYEPDSGECVAGPCRGSALFSIPIEIREGRIYVESEFVPES